jgi:hypothetical protein
MPKSAELSGPLANVKLERGLPRRGDLGAIFDELDYQLATQTYLWALPLVSYAQWQTVHSDVFGAGPCDLVHYRSYRDRLGLITANVTTPYTLGFFDLGRTGPLVVELPAGPTAGGVSDFWQREIATMGEMGPDQGSGGRYLIVPPGQDPPAQTAGYRILTATGMNIMFGFRTLDPDPTRAQALIEAVRIHPFAQRDNPPPTRLVSPDGRAWSGDQPSGLAYWERLHQIYQREVTDERDRFYLAMLRQLGIEKDREFPSDERLRRILSQGATAGELIARANSFAKRFPGSRYWPDRQWDLVLMLDSPDQRAEGYDQLLERAAWFYEAVSYSQAMKSQTPGKGQAYLGAYTDVHGQWLDGGKPYALHVPADPPAKLFWSITLYDAQTRCLLDNPQQRGDRGSRDDDLAYNDDGSVTLHFAPTAPAGRESNWVQTLPGRNWFAYARFYGPLQPYFDRSWKLDDINPA